MAKNLFLGSLFFRHPVALIVAFSVIRALPVIVAFPYYIWVSFFTYMYLGPSCTVFYRPPTNYRVVHLVIFYWYWYWYCMVLYCTALYCIVSYGILCYLIVSNSIAQYCTLLRCCLRRAGCVLQDAYILHVILYFFAI